MGQHLRVHSSSQLCAVAYSRPREDCVAKQTLWLTAVLWNDFPPLWLRFFYVPAVPTVKHTENKKKIIKIKGLDFRELANNCAHLLAILVKKVKQDSSLQIGKDSKPSGFACRGKRRPTCVSADNIKLRILKKPRQDRNSPNTEPIWPVDCTAGPSWD